MIVLIANKGYLPGYKYGGPIRSLAAIVERVGSQISFEVIASNRDAGEREPYPEIESDKWTQIGKASVLYSSRWPVEIRVLRSILIDRRPDLIYLNSFFDSNTLRLLAARKLGLLPRIPVLLAPRGEFSGGALAQKSRKKCAYIRIASILGLYDGIQWHASSELERDDISNALGITNGVHIARNLAMLQPTPSSALKRKSPVTRFVFFSRITRKKNLSRAIELLKHTSEPVRLDVIGPISDDVYWAECLKSAGELPPNVKFEYLGELPHDQLMSALDEYDFFLFPTLGENFGHTIAEALKHGLPVLTSDQTPWRDLSENGVGWSLALYDEEAWRVAIQECIEMDDATYAAMSAGARAYAEEMEQLGGGETAMLKMFHASAGREE